MIFSFFSKHFIKKPVFYFSYDQASDDFSEFEYNDVAYNQEAEFQKSLGFEDARDKADVVSIWKLRLLKKHSSKSWSSFEFKNDKIIKLLYNDAFVDELRAHFEKHDHRTYKTNDEIIEHWKSRREAESESKKLEIVHSGIDEHGKIQIKLEWNDAFIRHLKENGFNAEDESEIVQKYLAAISKDNAPGISIDDVDDKITISEAALASLENEIKD